MIRIVLALALTLTLAACQSAEERAEGHYQSALALLAEGDLDRATVEFRNVFELNGTHVEARRTYAQALREAGRISEAYGQFLRLAEQLPDDVETRIVLAEMAMDTQNWAQLRVHGERILSLVPAELRDDARIDVIAVTLDYSGALEADNVAARRDAALAAARVLETSPDALALRRIIIDNALRDNDTATALTLVDEALARAPGNRELHNTRLQLMAGLEDAEGVTTQLGTMIDLFPEDQELVSALLRFLVARGEIDEAEAVLRARIDVSEGEQAEILRTTLVQFLIQSRGPEAALTEVSALIEAFPDTLTFQLMQASIRFAMGETDAAIAQMEGMVEGAGTEPSVETDQARITLARMYMGTGNPVGARRLIGEVLANDATQTDAMKMEAEWLISDDRADDAVALLRRALNEAPNDTEAMTLMARAHQRNGNHDLVRDFLSLAFDASNAAPAETLRYADHLIGDELYLAAEEVLITALRLQPGNLELLNRLGTTYLLMEDWGRAEGVETSARRQNTEAATALADGLRAARLTAQGQMADAIGFLQDLAEGEDGSENLAAQVAVVRALLADGQTEAALTYTREAVAGAPDNLALLLAQAAAEAANGDPDAAIATYRQITELAPTFERGWIELIRATYASGDRDRAEAVLDDALATLPEGLNLLWAQASFLEQAGDVDGAISIYERLYQEMPDSPVVANNLASLISTYREDPENLERAYAIARRLRGTEVPPLMDTYGWIVFRRGDIEEARPYLAGAAEALVDDPLVQYHYGMLLAASGDRDAAIAQLSLALELAGPDDPRAQFETARAELARLEAAPDGEETGTETGQ